MSFLLPHSLGQSVAKFIPRQWWVVILLKFLLPPLNTFEASDS